MDAWIDINDVRATIEKAENLGCGPMEKVECSVTERGLVFGEVKLAVFHELCAPQDFFLWCRELSFDPGSSKQPPLLICNFHRRLRGRNLRWGASHGYRFSLFFERRNSTKSNTFSSSSSVSAIALNETEFWWRAALWFVFGTMKPASCIRSP